MVSSTNTVGYTANTSKHLLLDAGAFYKNYGDVSEALLGATQGGGEFKAVATFRQIPIDGVKGSAKGLSVVENWEVSLTANLLEVTTDIIKLALGVADVDSVTDVTTDVITGRVDILDTDYLSNIAWVGKLSGSDKPVIIKVLNALSTEGIQLKTEDNKEGVLPITFMGHFDPTNPNEAPFEIRYPKIIAV